MRKKIISIVFGLILLVVIVTAGTIITIWSLTHNTTLSIIPYTIPEITEDIILNDMEIGTYQEKQIIISNTNKVPFLIREYLDVFVDGIKIEEGSESMFVFIKNITSDSEENSFMSSQTQTYSIDITEDGTTPILPILQESAKITISPKILEVTSEINEQKDYQITIYNGYDFDIFDFDFDNLESKGFTFPNIMVEKNSTKYFTILFKPTTSIHENLQVPVNFKYFTNLPLGTITHEINIIDAVGFTPNYLQIKKGDSVKFNNNHPNILDIEIEGNSYSIQVNSSITHQFNTLGQVNYQDEYFNFFGVIEVLDSIIVEKTQNPNYEIDWSVNINTILNSTTLNLSNISYIKKGDSVKFNNNYPINLEVVIEGNTYNILSGSSITHQFNNIGIINYYDTYFNFNEEIEVIEQEKIIQPESDFVYEIIYNIPTYYINSSEVVVIDGSENIEVKFDSEFIIYNKEASTSTKEWINQDIPSWYN